MMVETLLLAKCHLFWSQSEELVGFVQNQVVQAQEQEAVTLQQTDQTEGRGHQQQAWVRRLYDCFTCYCCYFCNEG